MRPFHPATLVSLCTLACVAERGPLTNEMKQSGTRYLERAARQPVGWQPWGCEAFRLAARLDRPILLYVGADECRWCAVMHREAYADIELGALIDSLFVPVRVARDERPDVAQRYGVAVQLLTGLRGYPLTVFLTPEGSPFFGGTYFPADDPMTGRGMKQILPEVARTFREQRAFVRRQAAVLRQLAHTREAGARGVLEPRAVAAAIDSVRATLDGALRARAPLGSLVYTQAAALLLATAARGNDSSDLEVARSVLDAVADSGEAAAAESADSGAERSGLAALDALLARAYRPGRGVRHVPGRRAAAPTLMQDQVQVAGACLAAYNASGEPRYLSVAEDLAALFERDFADPMGGYFDASGAVPAAPALADRTKQVLDDLLPGANAWAARVLLQLADATGDAVYRRRAEATLEAFAGVLPAEGVRASSYLTAAQAVFSPR